MNKKSLFALLSVFGFSLTACETVKDYKEHLDDYVFAMKFHEGFNILQLTDIHWSYTSSTSSSKQYLEKLLKVCDEHVKANNQKNRFSGAHWRSIYVS